MRFKALALMAALCAPITAFAQQHQTNDTSKSDTSKSDTSKSDTSKSDMSRDKSAKVKLTPDEMQIMAHYHHVNQMEIDMGKMAQRQGSTQAVKDYGKTLVTDHMQNDKDMMAFAKKQGVTIPHEKPANEAEKQEQKDMMDSMAKMKKMKGADFDRSFAQMSVMGHEKQLARIDQDMSTVQSADLQQLLRDTKPMLQRHEDMAKDLEKNAPQATPTNEQQDKQDTNVKGKVQDKSQGQIQNKNQIKNQ